MKSFVYLTGSLSASLTVLGLLFKIQHWPGASVMLVLGMAMFALFFSPAFAFYKYAKS